jgi:hypothetical protein
VRLGVPAAHTYRCSSADHGHNGCKSVLRRGSRHKGSVVLAFPSASGPMGSRRQRAFREIVHPQRRLSWHGARHRVELAGLCRCRACTSTGRSAFYRIGCADATSPSSSSLSPYSTCLFCRREGGVSSRPSGSLQRPLHNPDRHPTSALPTSFFDKHNTPQWLHQQTSRRQISTEIRRH